LHAQNKTIDSLLQEVKTAAHDSTRCYLLNLIVENYADENIWVKYNEQMKNLAEKNLNAQTSNDKRTKKVFLKYLSVALNNIGYLNDSKGNIPEAIDFYNQSLNIMSEIDDKEGIAVSLNNIGFIYDNQGNIAQALEYYSKSLKIQEQIGNKKGIAQSYNNIASIYEHQQDIEKALDYYNQSLKLKLSIGDKPGAATTLNNIGHIYHLKKNDNKAILYFQKSLDIHIQLKNKNGISTTLSNIADIHQTNGNYDRALALDFESLKNAKEIDHKECILSALNSIGEIYYSKKEYTKALEYGLQSTEVNRKTGYVENTKGSALLLYRTYAALKDPKNALASYELFVQMRDSINNQETRKASIRSQFKYIYEKKAVADSIKVAEEKKLVQIRLKQDENQRYFLYAGLLLTLIFGSVMFNRFKVAQKQKNIIDQQKQTVEKQKKYVDEKQKEIMDSIYYARRIQQSLLPTEKYIERIFKTKKN